MGVPPTVGIIVVLFPVDILFVGEQKFLERD
jgi:hypothetical protein